MLHTIINILQSATLLSLNLTFWFLIAFTTGAITSPLKSNDIVNSAISSILLLLLVTTPITPLILSLPILLLSLLSLFIFDTSPNNTPASTFWNLAVHNLNLLIQLRTTTHIPTPIFFFLAKLSKILLIVFLVLSVLIFSSISQGLTIALTLFLSLTATLLGASLSFFFSLTSPSPYHPSFRSSPPIQASSFSQFLKKKIETHPLGALIEETFYEDNLQIGDFFIAYPLFFKAESPTTPPSLETEILRVWHTLRWESAFSNKLGSGVARWFSITGSKISSTPDPIHSIHVVIIPIFNNELYNELNTFNLPTFDPFNQPQNWSPLLILGSHLNWDPNELKEERINEMEEED